jgi:hypothetical protein
MLLTLAIGVTPVAAWYDTGEQAISAWLGNYSVGKHASSLQYGYSQGGSHSDAHPQFYANLVSVGDWGDTTPWDFIPKDMWIKVWGYDPLGQILSGDRFTSLSVLMSPDESGVEIAMFDVLWVFLGDVAPEGVLAVTYLIQAASGFAGSDTEYHTTYAQAVYHNPLGWLDRSDSQRGMRFGFQLAVDPTLEGTYDVYVEFKTNFWMCWNYWIPISKTVTTNAHVTYTYDDGSGGGGGGGGCPLLSVYDGEQYVTEGLLNIHAEEDVTLGARLITEPAAVGNKYQMKLTEHPQTISHIDSVQLFGRTASGTVVELPLVYARHSTDGNVKHLLAASDDLRIDTKGADHNDGTSEYINLRFKVPNRVQIVEFILLIEGYNAIIKR